MLLLLLLLLPLLNAERPQFACGTFEVWVAPTGLRRSLAFTRWGRPMAMAATAARLLLLCARGEIQVRGPAHGIEYLSVV